MSIFGSMAGLPVPRADWAQTDEKAADFILHKPDLSALEEAGSTALSLAREALPKTGGSLSGGLDLGGNPLTGLPAPERGSDGATKAYVDGKHYLTRFSLPAAGWTGSGPYTQEIADGNILETDAPHFGAVYDSGAEAQKEAFALIDELEAFAGRLLFRCYGEKPAVDVTVILEVNR